MNMICENCKYWCQHQAKERGHLGKAECHRNPPVIVLGMIHLEKHPKHDLDGFWPVTEEDDWCGEWKGDLGEC